MNIDSTGTGTSTLASTAGEPTTLALPSAITPALSFPHLAKSNNIDSKISSSAGTNTAALLALARGADMAPASAVTPVPLSTRTTTVSTAAPIITSTVSDGDDKAAIAIATVGAAAADQNIKPLLQNQHSPKQEYDELERAQQEQHRREKVIDLVLRQAKIHKVSRRLRSRLEFAILKIRRGWSKYTLQEVEALVKSSPPNKVAIPPSFSSASASSQSPSPPPSSAKKHKQPLPETKKRSSSASSTSPTRQSGRKRVPRVYPDYEPHADLYPSQHDDSQDVEDEDRSAAEPVRRRSRRLSQSTAIAAAVENLKDETGGSNKKRRVKGGRPSYSEYKDSELFSPAQSLMEIATSAPGSPALTAYQPAQYERQPYSPYGYGSSGSHYREGYSSPYSASLPNSPRMDVNRIEENPPSDAQAAESILLLASSPTRSAPRALNPGYLQPQSHSQHHHHGHHHHHHHHLHGDQSQRGSTASPVMHHAELPYSPMTSSPLVQFPAVVSRQSSPAGDDEDEEDNPFMPAPKRSSTKTGSATSKTAGSPNKKESLVSRYGKKKEAQSQEQEPALHRSSLGRRTSITSQFGLQRSESKAQSASTTTTSSSSSRAVTPTSPNQPSLPPQTPMTRRASQKAANPTDYGIQTPPPSMNKELNAPPPAQLISSFSGSRAGSPTPGGSKTVSSSIKTRRMSSGLAGGGTSAAVDPKESLPKTHTTDLRDIFPVHSSVSTTGSNSPSPVIHH